MSLPQRGETALEMFAHDNPQSPAKTFEGHTDVVKEFVWRRSGQGKERRSLNEIGTDFLLDLNKFQLITWSKDKTLRFWPITNELINVSPPFLFPLFISRLLRKWEQKASR